MRIKEIKEIARCSSSNNIALYSKNTDYSCSLVTGKRSLKKAIKRFFKGRYEISKNTRNKKSINICDLRGISFAGIEKVRLHCDWQNPILGKYNLYSVAEDRSLTDVYNKNVSKYKAIVFLQQKGLLPDDGDIAYFGDDTNDIECFDNVKYCVAMGNAIEDIKNIAYMITDDCDHKGISNAISKLIKIQLG